jgi:hypothetical protein
MAMLGLSDLYNSGRGIPQDAIRQIVIPSTIQTQLEKNGLSESRRYSMREESMAGKLLGLSLQTC